MPEKIKIGVDIDDVLFSFNQSFLDFYNEKHNTNYKMEDQHTYNYRIFLNSIDKETEITLFEEFYTSKYHDITLAIEDSIEYISHLKDFELISITARPVHTKDITEKWLDKHFPNIFSNIHYTTKLENGNIEYTISKGELAKNLNIKLFIDDSLHNAENIAEQKIDVILFDKPWNRSEIKKELENKIHRVYSWKEIVEKVKELVK